jgi:hypothetical protein
MGVIMFNDGGDERTTPLGYIMRDAACVVHEYDQTQNIIISRVSGRIGVSAALQIVTSAARMVLAHEASGIIYDCTEALTCFEESDLPVICRRALIVLKTTPLVIVDPRNHALMMRYADLCRHAGRPIIAALTTAEARSYLDYMTIGHPSRRTNQINHLVRAAVSLSPDRLSGLIDAVQSLAEHRVPDRGK